MPGRVATTVLFSLWNQRGRILVIIILAKGLALPVTWLQCVVIVPLALLATTIPISISGWGVRESAFVAGFGVLDVPSADALAMSVLFGILNTVVRLPGGLVWLAVSNVKKVNQPAIKGAIGNIDPPTCDEPKAFFAEVGTGSAQENAKTPGI